MPDEQLLFGQRIPDPPYQGHSETSRAAAVKAKASAKTGRARVLWYIRSQGQRGATDPEIQKALCMGGDTERPRRRELERMALIRGSGRARQTASGRHAVVWVGTTSRSDQSEQSD